MANAPSKLTVDQQILVSSVADEITETTSIHQQAIVRMLAVAGEHNLNAANLLQDLGVEMKSATSRQIPFVVEDLNSGLSAVKALALTPGIIPESTAIALAVAESQGLQKPLNHALLNTANKREPKEIGTDDFEVIDRISKLVQKYIFLLCILSFLMLFIIPQFKAMFEEFGIELPFSMMSLIGITNFIIHWWFLFALFFMALGGYLIYKNPRIITNYFTRWIPNRWGQPVLTKRTQKDLSVAWVVQASDNLPDAANHFIGNSGVDTEELSRLATDDSEPSGGFIEALASKRVISKRASLVASTASSCESAAWMLRTMSKAEQSIRRERGLVGLRALIWIGEFFMMAISAWAAIAIFQSLLSIIQGLTGHA